MANETMKARNELAVVKIQHQLMIGRAVRKLRAIGYDYATIADILGIKESAVRSVEEKKEKRMERLKQLKGIEG